MVNEHFIYRVSLQQKDEIMKMSNAVVPGLRQKSKYGDQSKSRLPVVMALQVKEEWSPEKTCKEAVRKTTFKVLSELKKELKLVDDEDLDDEDEDNSGSDAED
jgi:hypothetical protein